MQFHFRFPAMTLTNPIDMATSPRFFALPSEFSRNFSVSFSPASVIDLFAAVRRRTVSIG